MSLAPVNTVLLVDRIDYTLKLMKRSLLSTKFEVAKSYPISIGADGYRTPHGLYDIRRRAKNPDWQMPSSDWVPREDWGTIIPGGDPRNPIKARWLEVYEGVGIHGTADEDSIGTRASHGCIRMHVPDVIDLYPEVRIGTLVHIT